MIYLAIFNGGKNFISADLTHKDFKCEEGRTANCRKFWKMCRRDFCKV